VERLSDKRRRGRTGSMIAETLMAASLLGMNQVEFEKSRVVRWMQSIVFDNRQI
jgi:hypothetical protein